MVENNTVLLNSLLQEYKRELKQMHYSEYFTNTNTNGYYLQVEENFINRILDDSKNINESSLAMQRSFNIYNFFAHYALVALEDEKLFFQNIAIAGAYAKKSIELLINHKDCFTKIEPFDQNQLFYTLSYIIITGNINDAKKLASFIIENIEELINLKEDTLQGNLWFVLKLLDNNFEIDNKNIQCFTHPYDKYEDNETNQFANLLLQLRIELLKEVDNNEHIIHKIFPYEALVYLKLSKSKEKNFDSQLMNTKIIKEFLKFETIELEDVDLILQLEDKLSNQMNIGKEDKKIKELIASKTGEYKAVLPHNHPQANELRKEPFAYSYYTEGGTFNYDGLEDFDIENIKWILK